jgi:hypothetical protein
MLSDRSLRTLFSLVIAMLPPSLVEAGDTKDPPNPALCIECLKIRVGLPRVVRGPAPNTVDNTFSEIKLPNGRYRAERDDPQAAFALGGTYDAMELKRIGIPNFQSHADPAKAQEWYHRAADLGSAAAASRLDQLSRTGR